MNTKMKPDLWEEEFDENVKFDEAELGGNWSKQDVKNFIRDLLAQKEAKQEEQHRKELEGLKMGKIDIEARMKEEPRLDEYDYAEGQGYNIAVEEFNEAITNLLEQKGE